MNKTYHGVFSIYLTLKILRFNGKSFLNILGLDVFPFSSKVTMPFGLRCSLIEKKNFL